jgi:hypothetical protein
LLAYLLFVGAYTPSLRTHAHTRTRMHACVLMQSREASSPETKYFEGLQESQRRRRGSCHGKSIALKIQHGDDFPCYETVFVRTFPKDCSYSIVAKRVRENLWLSHGEKHGRASGYSSIYFLCPAPAVGPCAPRYTVPYH